jgi:hypothetical protein
MSNMAMLKLLQHRMGHEDLTVHGLPLDVPGLGRKRPQPSPAASLRPRSHISAATKTELAYKRGDLFEKRRKLMAAWATFACTPKTNNIVMMGQRASA